MLSSILSLLLLVAPIAHDSEGRATVFGPDSNLRLTPVGEAPRIGGFTGLKLENLVPFEVYGMLFFSPNKIESENRWGTLLVTPELVIRPIMLVDEKSLSWGGLTDNAVGAMSFPIPNWQGLVGHTMHMQFVGTYPCIPNSAVYSNGVSWTFGN